MREDPRLHDRLRNCLQTILDLEQSLEQMAMSKPILAEFDKLKDIYRRLESLLIQEDDVRRIEEVTSSFLHELQYSMKNVQPAAADDRIIQ